MTLMSHPLTVRLAERYAAPHIEQYAHARGWSVDAYRQAVRVRLGQLMKGVHFWVRMKDARLAAFLSTGILPGYHDDNDEPGNYRTLVEALQFNLPPRTRLTYGALSEVQHREYTAAFMPIFGEITLRLRIQPEASFTVGPNCYYPERWKGRVSADNQWAMLEMTDLVTRRWDENPERVREIWEAAAPCWKPAQAASLIHDPHELSWGWGRAGVGCPLDVPLGGVHEIPVLYVEAQNPGPITLSDIEAVHIYDPARRYWLLKQLTALGVPITKGKLYRIPNEYRVQQRLGRWP